jgi:pimeloyl-ACP methyl ester carboxylesterase
VNTIYFISGLGADERAFQLLKINHARNKYIEWLIPEKNDSLEHYIAKLSKQITDPEHSILIGLSFGGIIAIELSKINTFHKTILISSIKSVYEMPGYMKFLKYTKLYKCMPGRLLNRYNFIIAYAFGIANKFENAILKNVIEETNPKLVKWAIDKIINWSNTMVPDNVIHIHGSEDRLFPFKNIKNAFKIDGGTHFMIVNKPDIISTIINNEIR